MEITNKNKESLFAIFDINSIYLYIKSKHISASFANNKAYIRIRTNSPKKHEKQFQNLLRYYENIIYNWYICVYNHDNNILNLVVPPHDLEISDIEVKTSKNNIEFNIKYDNKIFSKWKSFLEYTSPIVNEFKEFL